MSSIVPYICTVQLSLQTAFHLICITCTANLLLSALAFYFQHALRDTLKLAYINSAGTYTSQLKLMESLDTRPQMLRSPTVSRTPDEFERVGYLCSVQLLLLLLLLLLSYNPLKACLLMYYRAW